MCTEDLKDDHETGSRNNFTTSTQTWPSLKDAILNDNHQFYRKVEEMIDLRLRTCLGFLEKKLPIFLVENHISERRRLSAKCKIAGHQQMFITERHRLSHNTTSRYQSDTLCSMFMCRSLTSQGVLQIQ
jgi:hypothetical protein